MARLLMAAAWAVLVTAGSVGLTSTLVRAQAKGPAFDCSKAAGEVEKLICSDEGLAALDRKLDEVYQAARAKARDDVPKWLRAEQRGWLKGRDECWKAQGPGSPVYLTESWIATDARACVEGTYRMRTAELQALFQLVAGTEPVFFSCNNNPADEFVATFFDTELPAARVERGDKTVTAWLVKTASGARYEGPNFSLWTKGKEAIIVWMGQEMKCKTP